MIVLSGSVTYIIGSLFSLMNLYLWLTELDHTNKGDPTKKNNTLYMIKNHSFVWKYKRREAGLQKKGLLSHTSIEMNDFTNVK